MMQWKSIEDAGVNLSFGNDWVAEPFGPFYGLIMASIRMNYLDEFDWGPEETVDHYDAITHGTLASEKALKMEKEVGSIQAGKFGDFVIHNVDHSTITGEEFLAEHGFDIGTMDDFVDMTLVGGKVVYEREKAIRYPGLFRPSQESQGSLEAWHRGISSPATRCP